MSNQSSVPLHLGIIPDGNRRWAKAQGLPTLEGHRRGLEVARTIAEAAHDAGVRYFSIYAFSTENWARTEEEVGYLMNLFVRMLTREMKGLEERGVRLRLIGSRDRLPKKLIKALDEAEARTADNQNGTIGLCLNYGGHAELADATRSLLASHAAPEVITPADIEAHLYAPEIPPVDLIIRTSGEHRLSGFMLWRAQYAELAFVDKHWPDFTSADLEAILADYAQRQRRFGA